MKNICTELLDRKSTIECVTCNGFSVEQPFFLSVKRHCRSVSLEAFGEQKG